MKWELRQMRAILANDLKGDRWIPHLNTAARFWEQGWQKEKCEMIPGLVVWLRYDTHIPRMADVTFREKPMPEPKPPADHDLNYGQQLVQMYHMLRRYHSTSGFLQGIPKPRHEPDWSCQDVLIPLPKICYGAPHAPIPASNPDAHGELKQNKPFPTDLPHPDATNAVVASTSLLSIGEAAAQLTKPQDAPSVEARKKMEQTQSEEQKENKEAIDQAHREHYGPTRVVEGLQSLAKTAANSADKAKSYFEWLRSDKHTTDLEGSFNKAEVNLAFRNHGTHFESLDQPITPLGAHYLLIHFDVQYLKKLEAYRLKVHGCVERPLEFSFAELLNLAPSAITHQPVVMECSGNGRSLMKPRFNHHVPWALQAFGCYIWTGVPLRVILKAVGVKSEGVDVVFTGYDAGMQDGQLRHYQRSVEMSDPVLDMIMVCWQHNGTSLLPEHGYPIRVLTPGWYGDNNVKWLQSIEVVDYKFKGRNMVSYSYTKQEFDRDIAVPSQEIRPRAMIKPMGFPSFMTRQRMVQAGMYTWEGKAWVGGGFYRTVMAVEVSIDDGKTWSRARLEPRLGMFAWHRFTYDVTLQVGIYVVKVRATDSTGHQQKVELGPEDWNWHGMCDDACQTIFLTVVDQLTVTT